MSKAQKAKARRAAEEAEPVPRRSTLRPPRPRDQDEDYAFLPELRRGHMRAADALAEALAEEFIHSVTSAEEAGEAYRDAVTPEEYGGPFVVATANEELAYDDDPGNPEGAAREPFPTAVRVPPG